MSKIAKFLTRMITRGWLPTACLIGLLWLPGCGSNDTITADNSGLKPVEEDDAGENAKSSDETTDPPKQSGNPTDGGETPKSSGSEADTALPEGGAVKLMKYIHEQMEELSASEQHLRGAPLDADTRKLVLEERAKIVTAIHDAAGMILASKETNTRQRLSALTDGIGAVSQLMEYGDDDAVDALEKFVEPWEKDANSDIRQQALAGSLAAAQFRLQQGENVDGATVVKKMQKVFELAGDFNPRLSEFGQRTAETLIQHDQVEQGIRLYRIIGDELLAVDNPTARAAGEQLLLRVAATEVSLELDKAADGDAAAASRVVELASSLADDGKLPLPLLQQFVLTSAVLADNQHEKEAAEIEAVIIAAVTAQLAGDSIDEAAAVISQQVLQTVEITGQFTLASKISRLLSEATSRVDSQTLATAIQESVQASEIRLNLVGQTISLEGETLDGSTFDWSQYQGKVVLVDFWATWCGPCIQELPNIKANYDKYHEHGFEVVGVSIDDARDQVTEFHKTWQERSGWAMPWESLYNFNPEEKGFKKPLPTKFGVKGIPFVLLVGKDGKVVDIHTRGPRLGEQLAKLFPDVAAATEADAGNASPLQ